MDNDRHLDDPDGNGGERVVEKDEKDVADDDEVDVDYVDQDMRLILMLSTKGRGRCWCW